MEWLLIISLIVIGLSLIILEIVIVPGTTIVGIFGVGLAVTGIVLSFKNFGSGIGWAVFSGTAVLATALLYWSFRTKAWRHFALKSSITSRVNENTLIGLQEGMEGITLSVLRPSGKAEIDNRTFEVTTLGNYVDPGIRIRIIRILSHEIIVEPLTKNQ
jgi:membrane-bound ClpP family serine protease